MKKEQFIAKTYAGFETILEQELLKIGAKNSTVLSRGVQFEGEISLLYRANYFSRFALRVLWQIEVFSFENNADYYNAITKIPIENYLSVTGSFAISCTMHNTIFKTPLFASLLAKDAICDHFREKYGKRPNVDKDNPDVQIHLHIFNDTCYFYLDSSGESLHKRGYKVSNHPAAINEVTAAAMISLSGWNAQCDIIDPMCGGGTILIEAAMQALNIPAGFYRQKFGFFSWLNFDKTMWKSVINEAEIKDDVPINFYGYDNNSRYLGMAKANVEEANLRDFITLEKRDVRKAIPKKTPAYIIFNPPYGERLEIENINEFYKEIGDALKKNFTDCKAFLISSDFEALKAIGLKTFMRKTMDNGPLECRFLGYDLYVGTKKQNL